MTHDWRFIGIVAEGGPISLNGLDPWAHKWTRCEETSIRVSHPNYPAQRHAMHVYQINNGAATVRFAAGEFSNSVWGFYLPC
jgi:hypothetical protein